MRLKNFRPIIVFGLFLALAIALADAAVAQNRGTGLPLPRYVSLRASEVNMRTGPGVQYPVEWVYRRQHLPVEIIADYGTWRKVRDWQATQGWVHQSMLAGRRTFVVTDSVRTLRSRTDSNSGAVARLEPGVIGRILGCPADSGWCKVEAEGREGWLRRVEIWGVYRHETLE